MITENRMQAPNGIVVLLALIAVTGVLVYAIVADIRDNFQIGFLGLICILSLPVVGVLCAGFFTVNPNEGRVLQFFGRYIGTVQAPGLRWANPFYTKERVSLRVRNFETASLRLTTNAAIPSRLPPWLFGRLLILLRPSSKLMTTSTTYTCRARRRCAT